MSTTAIDGEGATAAGYSRTLGRLRLLAVYLLVLALLSLARPQPAWIAVGTLVAAAGEALRIWAAGHLTKTERLVTSGPYRFTRNPLYLGRLLIFSGLCLMARLPYAGHWVVLVAGWAVFFGYYLPRKERVEPARLLAVHGEAYARYRRSVPALLPTSRPYRGGHAARWTLGRCLANREHWMVVGLLAAAAFLLLRAG